MLKWLSPLRFALLLTAFDGLWAAQAMSITRVHAVSNVELLSLILWCYFHLPAVLLAGALPLGPRGLPAESTTFSTSSLLAMVLLGLLQTFGLSYGLWRLWRRRSLA